MTYEIIESKLLAKIEQDANLMVFRNRSDGVRIHCQEAAARLNTEIIVGKYSVGRIVYDMSSTKVLKSIKNKQIGTEDIETSIGHFRSSLVITGKRYKYEKPPPLDIRITQVGSDDLGHHHTTLEQGLTSKISATTKELTSKITANAAALRIHLFGTGQTSLPLTAQAVELPVIQKDASCRDELKKLYDDKEKGQFWYDLKEEDIDLVTRKTLERMPEYNQYKAILFGMAEQISRLNQAIPLAKAKDGKFHFYHVSKLASHGKSFATAKKNKHRIELDVMSGGNQVFRISKEFLRLFHLGTKTSQYFGKVSEVYLESKNSTIQSDYQLVHGESIYHYSCLPKPNAPSTTHSATSLNVGNQYKGFSDENKPSSITYRYEGPMKVQHVQCVADGEERKIAKIMQAYGFDQDEQNPRFELFTPNLLIQAKNNNDGVVYASLKTDAKNKSMALMSNMMTMTSSVLQVKTKHIDIKDAEILKCDSKKINFKTNMLRISGLLLVG